MPEGSSAPTRRERQLTRIEMRLASSERQLDALAADPRVDRELLQPLRLRIEDARATIAELRRAPREAELEDITDHLARWIGNVDTLPTPPRQPPPTFGDPRRRD